MSSNSLTMTVEATRESLQQRLAEATQALHAGPRAAESRERTNAFMVATSRHLAAVEEVLVPEASRRLADGDVAGDYQGEARHLEQSMARLKARVYGELNAVSLSLDDVWDDVRDGLERHNEAEELMVDRLVDALDHDQAENLATKVYRAELKAPTRAHPYIPHTGVIGLVSRRIWAFADRFWDVTQNRTVPLPVRPPSKRRQHESLMTQFLTGEPTLDPEAPFLEHHPERRRGRRHPR